MCCNDEGVPIVYQPTAKALSPVGNAHVSATEFQGMRSRILEAALAEFADRGFEETSLAAIARKVGATAPLVLYHFGSKANLWKDAVEILCTRLDCVVVTALEDGRGMSGNNALRVMVRRLVHFFAANPAMHRLLRDDAVAAGAHADWLGTSLLAPIFARIESVFRRAVDEGSVRPMAFELALFMILGAASQYLDARKLIGKVFGRCDLRTEWKADYVEQVLDFCFAGLSTEPLRSVSGAPLRIAAGR